MQAGGAVSRQTINPISSSCSSAATAKVGCRFVMCSKSKARRSATATTGCSSCSSTTTRSVSKGGRAHGAEHKLFVGNVARTINIPTLAMMFLHPRVNERFEFTDEGEETINGRVLRARRLPRSRTAHLDQDHARPRPGTHRDHLDRPVQRHRDQDRTARRRSGGALRHHRDVPQGRTLDFWVPDKMEEYYKAASGSTTSSRRQLTPTSANTRSAAMNTNARLPSVLLVLLSALRRRRERLAALARTVRQRRRDEAPLPETWSESDEPRMANRARRRGRVVADRGANACTSRRRLAMDAGVTAAIPRCHKA